jgi:NADH-quinone oxidoreductase subunit C
MSAKLERLQTHLQAAVPMGVCTVACGEVTLEVAADQLLAVAQRLRDDNTLSFESLVDLCGVDYLAFGRDEWFTEEATSRGFSRAKVANNASHDPLDDAMSQDFRAGGVKRFAAVSHLLSVKHNWRIRLRTFAPDDGFPVLPSLCGVWNSANWFEREAFDLFGIVFEGHPDLRRLLTDYGFIGHPFRKDFPLIGNVEVVYDPEKKRVVYQPVSIDPRVNVPRVIREDNRYLGKPMEGVKNA